MSTDTLTRPDADILLDTKEDAKLGNSECSHIIKEQGGSGAGKVTESRVFGTPLEALCGYVFTAEKDTKGRPVCPRCKEIYELDRSFDEELNDIDDMNRG